MASNIRIRAIPERKTIGVGKYFKFLKPKIWYHPLVMIISMLTISTFFLIFYHHPLMEKNKELTSEEQAKSSS
ncbi:MAG: hypothetical protein QXH17_03745, partial [Candidatus Bathyarchaeia archaeon]